MELSKALFWTVVTLLTLFALRFVISFLFYTIGKSIAMGFYRGKNLTCNPNNNYKKGETHGQQPAKANGQQK